MKTSSTREQNIKQYFDKAAEIEYSLLPKAKTKHNEITLKELIATDQLFRVRSGRCWQLWILRKGIAMPVMQRRGGCFVVSIEFTEFSAYQETLC
ncbi:MULTISPECIES: hypothetical protein [Gammaproteobacteria]|uniref:hypothetical protein n=1 Tax=Gammaproteobacteria TaxID=1236 RepID=UPI003A976852